MAVKLEVGKFYKTRDGDKVGPMEKWAQTVAHKWQQRGGTNTYDGGGDIWADDGSSIYRCPDLIAEWTEDEATTGPVRTVTRKEIVDGKYGNVEVYYDIAHGLTVTCRGCLKTHAEIRATIATLTEIAEALEDQA